MTQAIDKHGDILWGNELAMSSPGLANNAHGGVYYGNVRLGWLIVGTGTDVLWRSNNGDVENLPTNGSRSTVFGLNGTLLTRDNFNADARIDIVLTPQTSDVVTWKHIEARA